MPISSGYLLSRLKSVRLPWPPGPPGSLPPMRPPRSLFRPPGPGRLDGCIQRQQVGLAGDRADQADNAVHRLRRVCQRAVLLPTPVICSKALSVAERELAMLRDISPIDAASCSALAATDCTLDEVSPAAADADPASRVESSIAASISPKFWSISVLRLASNSAWAETSVANLTTFWTLPSAS